MSSALLAGFLFIASIPPSNQQGYVSGTVAVFSTTGRAMPCGELTLIVSAVGRTLRIKTDENGDYAPRLDVGKYRLQRVLDQTHRELRLHEGQMREFVVTPGNVTRFDVLLDAPCPSKRNSPRIQDHPETKPHE